MQILDVLATLFEETNQNVSEPRIGSVKLRLPSWTAALLFLFTRIASAGDYAIEIDLEEQRAYLLFHKRMILEGPICSGRADHPIPTGSFQVIEKDALHRSSLYGQIVDPQGRTLVANADTDMPVPPGGRFVNAPMPYFLRFTGGAGLHEGYLPGYPASHGCVRMPKEQAMAFYNAAEVGTPVTVFGHAPMRTLARRFSPPRGPSRFFGSDPIVNQGMAGWPAR